MHPALPRLPIPFPAATTTAIIMATNIEINNNKFARNQNSTPTTGDNTKTIVFNNGITGTATGNTYEDNGNPITVRYW